MTIFEKLIKKKSKISVVGLGYVGLPIALEFSKKFDVIGFDINSERIELMKNKIDPSGELSSEDFENTNVIFTDDEDRLKEADFHIIAVPTPINKFNAPDLKYVISASESVGSALKAGDYVVYESTVYPGCTEEDCIPILENMSGLDVGVDFKVGFSPERINPGDKHYTLTNIVKVVSGCDEHALENIADVYGQIIKAGIHKAPTIKVAEAAKIIENAQRDINIAFMNELSIIFNLLDINTYDVLEAAETKWNFLKFYPGLVGGHCIGVDPYYLIHKAKEYKYHPQVIDAGRGINDQMGIYAAKELIKLLIKTEKNIPKTKILALGATFKEDISDVRNSKVFDLVDELKTYGVEVVITDPFADASEVYREYGWHLTNSVGKGYDAVVLAVRHRQYLGLEEVFFENFLKKDGKGILIDLKGVYRNKIKNLTYWSF
jgi:UDP-N-acetyl-D-glucosamine/UDP-N-acetyl-D-galactosamine dehydrogenase